MDNEVHIEATGVTDRGLTYGSYLEMEVGSGDAPDAAGNDSFNSGSSGGNVYVDEVNLFFSGGFGRIELGRQDGAEDVMFVGGEDAQAGTGGIDGDTANLRRRSITSRSATPPRRPTSRRASAASSSAPASSRTASDDGGRDGAPDFGTQWQNVVGGGANWVGAFGGVDLTLSAVGVW